MSEARNHHFVSQFYLRKFASGTGRQARILSYDRKTKKRFNTLVRNVGAKRDFNRIEMPGEDPNRLEHELAAFEGQASTALDAVLRSRSLEDRDALETLLNYAALLAARRPQLRNRMHDFVAEIYQSMAEAMVANEDQYHAMLRQMREDPDAPKVNEDISFEDLRAFVEERRYEVVVEQGYLMGLEFTMVEPIIRSLVTRKWKLYLATNATGHFVTSDLPLSLIDLNQQRHPAFGPGFGMPDTAVFLPLSPQVGLFGTFEGDEFTMTLPRTHVASLNSQTIIRADRQVYAKDENFSFLDRQIRRGGDLLSSEIFLRPEQLGA